MVNNGNPGGTSAVRLSPPIDLSTAENPIQGQHSITRKSQQSGRNIHCFCLLDDIHILKIQFPDCKLITGATELPPDASNSPSEGDWLEAYQAVSDNTFFLTQKLLSLSGARLSWSIPSPTTVGPGCTTIP